MCACHLQSRAADMVPHLPFCQGGRRRRDHVIDLEAGLPPVGEQQLHRSPSSSAALSRQLLADWRPLAAMGPLRGAPPRAQAVAQSLDRGSALAGALCPALRPSLRNCIRSLMCHARVTPALSSDSIQRCFPLPHARIRTLMCCGRVIPTLSSASMQRWSSCPKQRRLNLCDWCGLQV